MCDPISLSVAVLAIGVASSGFSFMQQSSEASAARKDENANSLLQLQSFKLRTEEENKRSVDEKSTRAIQAQIERGRLRVTTGESGLAGNSNDKILEESLFNEGFDIASIEANRQSKNKQALLERKGLIASSQRRLNNIKKPSLIGAGLQIAGSAVGAATTFENLTTARRAPIQ